MSKYSAFLGVPGPTTASKGAVDAAMLNYKQLATEHVVIVNDAVA